MTTSPAALPRGAHGVVRARTPWWVRRPHAWLYAVAAAGWVTLTWVEVGRRTSSATSIPSGSPSDAPSDAMLPSATHAGHAAGADLGSWGWVGSWVGMAGHGALMLAMVAVMTPLVARNVRFAALRSPRRLRPGVALAVTGGWVSVWVLAAAGLAVAGWLVAAALGAVGTVVLATFVAAAWQWSPTKRLALSRCHQLLAPPLAPRPARAGGRRYGRSIGRSCVVSCLPFMALMTVSGHTLLVAAPVAGLAWLERCRRPHHDPATRLTAAGVAVVGGGAATLAALGLL